ncbi:uncharacterized protein [Aegilops tauschii subsp. strangulata]|uniref:uncharacterized protein n=1 Tax=Aegilops tauschii subsp. strangulata TaxID=200361 RepID=UPI00098B6128|nr:uncharacterized protein LOC109749456 [Aegilops tauschii subsp. strangulata]
MDFDLEYIYEHYVESPDSSSNKEEYSDETAMMQVVLEDAERAEEHVLKFKDSIKVHRVLNRNRAHGHLTLMDDYIAPDALFADHFRRCFQMLKTVFDRLYHGVQSYDDYFILKKEAMGTIGFSGYQKCTTALRMLAYGTFADSWDEYLRMCESTCGDAMVRFATAVVEVFGPQYLREPTLVDRERLLAISEARGRPGLLGSLDCMHWKWKNYPKALQGQYQGHVKKPTIILEAVASQDLWIWHAFFGMPGSHNDINVMQRSPLFARLTEGKACHYTINGHEYNMGYYLVDDIYPPWATFLSTSQTQLARKRLTFPKHKKQLERMSGGHLEFCRPVLQLFVDLLNNGIQKPCGR